MLEYVLLPCMQCYAICDTDVRVQLHVHVHVHVHLHTVRVACAVMIRFRISFMFMWHVHTVCARHAKLLCSSSEAAPQSLRTQTVVVPRHDQLWCMCAFLQGS